MQGGDEVVAGLGGYPLGQLSLDGADYVGCIHGRLVLSYEVGGGGVPVVEEAGELPSPSVTTTAGPERGRRIGVVAALPVMTRIGQAAPTAGGRAVLISAAACPSADAGPLSARELHHACRRRPR